jgi:predicted MPP superfamily phosphohydrolase
MPRAFMLATFIGLMTAITGLVHYYVWARLVRDTALSVPTTRWLTVLVLILFATIPLSFWLSRALPPEHGQGVLLLAYSWMGLAFYLFILLTTGDLLRAVGWSGLKAAAWAGHLPARFGPTERLAGARYLAMGVLVAGACLAGGALLGGARAPRVRELRVALPRLPSALDGTVLAVMTDLHLGPTLRREFLEDVVRRLNQLKPDAILVLGDLADGSVTKLRETVAPLGHLSAPWGVFFVTGNHEFYAGADAWCAELRRLNLRVLRGEIVSLGHGPHSFDLVGVDDLEARRFGSPASADVGRLLAGRDPEREVVLLAHQPKVVLEAQAYGVGLQLSGHTHGGQFWPWGAFVRLQQPIVQGLERFGNTLVYVSNGTGYWGPPMRLGAPAEITKVVLRRGEGPPAGELSDG